jgi:hypothetical protein
MDRNILHNSHVSNDSTAFLASGAGDSSFQSQISGYAAGTDAEKEAFINHYGREFYKKLNLLSVSHSHSVDAGFRPTNISQIYTL